MQKSYFNKWVGEQKFFKNSVKIETKFSIGIIEK